MEHTNNVTLLIPTDETAVRWLLFQEHYQAFAAIIDSGALNIKYGSVTLNFADGKLQNIHKNEVVYKK